MVAMNVVLVPVLLELASAAAEVGLKGAENLVRVLVLLLLAQSAKTLAAAALMLQGQNSEAGFEIVGYSKLLFSWSWLWSDVHRTLLER